MTDVVRIAAPTQPPPKGHYSPATAFGDLVFVSGQLPVTAEGPQAGPFGAQARCALANMLEVLAAAGGRPEDLLKVTAYVVGVANWDEFNAIFAEVLGPVRPARAIVPVPELHFGLSVEVEAVAARRR